MEQVQTLLVEVYSQKKTKKKEISPLEHIRSQRKWNLDRIAYLISKNGLTIPLFNFVTVGSSGKDPIELMEILKNPIFSTSLFVDVRKDPLSRYTPNWNKNKLQETCISYNIEYVHRPDFGVPTPIRKDLIAEKMNYAQFFEWYDANVLTPSHVGELIELIKFKNPAFLCTEIGPTYCHRHRIALRLERDFNMVGYDI
jgi:hypothetical protein